MVHCKDGEELECKLLELFGAGQYGDWRFHMHELWLEFAEAELIDRKCKSGRSVYEGGKCRERMDLREYPKLEVGQLNYVEGDVAVDVRGLKRLKCLVVGSSFGHDVTAEVSGVGTLERLTFLECWRVASIECIAEVGFLTNGEVVVLEGFRVDGLPDMSKLTSLRTLVLTDSSF